MRNLSTQAFHILCQQNDIKIIKAMKDKRPRVLETKDGHIIKIIHAHKTFLSSYKNLKAGKHFCKNARQLQKMQISAPIVTESFSCPELNNCIVIYKKLTGESMRSLTEKNPEKLLDIAQFIAELHQKGIFFRSLHIDNIILQPDGRFALIDIAVVRFKNKPLDFFTRYRNLRHMFSIRQDKERWMQLGLDKYLQHYYQYTSLSEFSQWMISKLMARAFKSHPPCESD